MPIAQKVAEAFAALAESWGNKVDAADAGVASVRDYLIDFGYCEDGITKTVGDVADAIRDLQRRAGIAVDGVPGAVTQAATRLPRCGVRENALRGGVGKWAKTNLTYALANYVDGIPIDAQDKIFAAGCDAWSRVCGLSFKRTGDQQNADLLLSVSAERREDFGRRNGVLAWAELPPSDDWDDQLRIKFDDAELWRAASGTGAGVILLNVWTHELGHAIGLDHSRIASALMAPYYAAEVARPVDPDDHSRAVELYGEPANKRAADVYTVSGDGALRLSGHNLITKG